MGEVAFAI